MKSKRRNYEEFEHSWEDLDGYERTTKFYFKIRFQRDAYFTGSSIDVIDWEGDEPSEIEIENVAEIFDEMLHEGHFEPEMPECYADLF